MISEPRFEVQEVAGKKKREHCSSPTGTLFIVGVTVHVKFFFESFQEQEKSQSAVPFFLVFEKKKEK